MPSEESYIALTQISPVLTNEKLSEALTNWFGRNIRFTHWEYVGGIGKGDSYLSEIMRIRIYGVDTSGNVEHVQVFLKFIPKSAARRLSFRSDEFFKNEVNFYNIVLPALLEFQAGKKVLEPFTKHVNPFFAYTDGVHDVVCVEDATLKNFRATVRQDGIDYDHCKISLKALAQFHALSFAMKNQNPQEFDRIRKSVNEIYYDERLWNWYEKFWHRICNVAVDAVEKEYPDSLYLKKIKEFAVPKTYKEMAKAAKTCDTGVISHGDSWTNNFLFKYLNGKPVDAKILDFQLVRCASPVLDVSVFIFACTTQELRLKHYDELLKYYHTTLSSRIEELGSSAMEVYPWEKFMDEIRRYSFLGLAFSLESTPLIVLPPENAFDMDIEGDKIVNIEEVWQIQPFKTREGRRREADNVVFCVDRGYI